MREIKFRGKDVDSGEWYYGSLNVYPNGKCGIVVFDDGEILEYEVDVESVGQFTGLHDISGEEIYEGDILDCDFGGGNVVPMKVQWHDDGFWSMTEMSGDDTPHFIADYLKEIHIVGNIFDCKPYSNYETHLQCTTSV